MTTQSERAGKVLRDRSVRDRDKHQTPETPPTEPQRIPLDEPSQAPNDPAPYVITDAPPGASETTKVTDLRRESEQRHDHESRIDRVARRAHQIYEARGGEHGRSLDDWLRAELEIDHAE
jgi:hypothetical protein